MATAGTLLSDLTEKTPVFHNDNDLVQKILADMNVPHSQNPVINAPQPPTGNGSRMMNAPNPNTVYPHTMDPATSTAHLIGKDYPNAADFANVLHPMPHGGYGGGYGGGNGDSGFTGSPYGSPTAHYPTLLPSTNPFYGEIISQLKQPLIVAIIIFVVSLPALHVLIGYYLPSLIRIGGDLTTVGLGVKAVIGGFLFWFLQKVLVPLMI